MASDSPKINKASVFRQHSDIHSFLLKQTTGVVSRYKKRYFELGGHYIRCVARRATHD
jgi:hypothetical protein